MSFKPDEFQQCVLDYEPQPSTCVRMEAVAGSGKTSTSVLKIKNLISKYKIPAEEITFITFSNKSAKDLAIKYNKLTGYNEKPIMSTIHSLSLSLLKKHFNIRPNLLNEWSSILVMRDALEETKLDKKYNCNNKRELTALASSILDVTQWYKSNVLTTTNIKDTNFSELDLSDSNSPDLDMELSDFIYAFKTYEDFKSINNQYDYSDLVFKLYIKLLSNPDILNKIKVKQHTWLVDEAQDLDTLLFELIFLLSESNNIYFIYDKVQTIYGFRWAAPYMLEDNHIKSHFDNIVDFKLKYNYRSTSNIVNIGNKCRDVARSQVEAIPFKKEAKGSVRFIKVKNNTLEGDKTAALIKEYLNEGYSYKDIAIIARTNSYLKSVIEPILAKESIPYTLQTKNRRKLFDKPAVKAYFDFISLLLDPTNTMSILSLSNNIKGIGDAFIDKL